METSSIVTIKDLLTQVHENLDAYQQYHKENSTDMDSCSYGAENEYCVFAIHIG